eukprot:TRINITY_DN12616_c0_g1_i2.p1 TRINITY_DN12616_c0_g1~~TRINITY_DN12616_c0_g1_i2.p1  ORF type:complete len:176 (+),score=21.54 TRINITY_DN12616_c0_g1_i2:23-550(+)
MSGTARIFSQTYIFNNHLAPENYQAQQLLSSLVSVEGFVLSSQDQQGAVKQNRLFVKEVNKEGEVIGKLEIKDKSIQKNLTSWNQNLENAINCKLSRGGGCSHQKDLMVESIAELMSLVRRTCKEEKSSNPTCNALFEYAQSKGKSVEGLFQETALAKLDKYSDEAFKYMRGELI